MKKILKNYTRTLLASLTVILLVIIIGYFIWGIGYIAYKVNQIDNGAAITAPVPDFNITAAAALNYKGLPN